MTDGLKDQFHLSAAARNGWWDDSCNAAIVGAPEEESLVTLMQGWRLAAIC